MSLWGKPTQFNVFEQAMINLFITYRCNLSCPYCFARKMQKEYPQDMQEKTFLRLLDWMQKAQINTVAFLGGEPTLHPNLLKMIGETARSGIAISLFTNGLANPELTEQLVGHVSNFVINCNSRQTYAHDGQFERFHETLQLLSDAGARVTLSRNFAPGDIDYSYLLETARRYHIRNIRYDISRPDNSCENQHFNQKETTALMGHILDFVRQCDSENIKTGLDCCLKFCEVSAQEREFLQQVSMKLTGICHPSIDVHPDLSASYCLPMRHISVEDVTQFSCFEWLIYHFSTAVREMRFDGAEEKCLSCPDYRRKCQGGCMGTRLLGPEAMPPQR